MAHLAHIGHKTRLPPTHEDLLFLFVGRAGKERVPLPYAVSLLA